MNPDRRYTHSASKQIEYVRNSTSKEAYDQLYKNLFTDYYISFWIETVDAHMGKLTNTQEQQSMYQLLGLTAILFAQYGFESMEGQSLRHNHKYKWSRPLLHRFHQVAVIKYAAAANLQAYAIKKDWQQLLEKAQFERPDLAWRIFPYISKGIAKKEIGREVTADTLINLITMLIPAREPIPINYTAVDTIEQMPDLNTKLSKLQLDGHKAEIMTPESFFAEIYPQFAQIVLDMLQLDLEPAFDLLKND